MDSNQVSDSGRRVRNSTDIPSKSGSRNIGQITRLIRSFTLFDNRDFLPRPYQIELYEACKNRGTIVFLRPGQGKHFISVMLVKFFSPYTIPYRADEPGKKIFFLSKSLNSIRIYSSVFQAHTDLRIGDYLNVEIARQWSTEEWKQMLSAYDIHLMTDVLFEHLLDASLVRPEQINLLILDDVHKILLTTDGQQDCYTRVVQKLRNISGADGSLDNKRYRILGLSASILLEDVSSHVFEKMITQIESELGCACETYADLRMINKYSIQSRIKLRVYPSLKTTDAVRLDDEQEIKFKKSLMFIRNQAAQFFSFISNISGQEGSMDSHLVISNESLAKIVADILYVYGTLGEWCTLKLIDLVCRELQDTISLISKIESNYLRMLNTAQMFLVLLRQQILHYLPEEICLALEKHRLQEDNNSADRHLTLRQFLSISAPKLLLLASVMSDYLAELCRPGTPSTPHSSFAFPANICSLIYAERRVTARVLSEWIQELANIATAECSKNSGGHGSLNCFSYLLPSHVFLEDSDSNDKTNFYYRKHQKSLHEIHFYRQQEEALRKFRLAHHCNLLVTTSMSAEGLDVNRCNMVVCFDPPKTFQQFIQSKGRVRVEKGQFVVMVEESEQPAYVKKFLEFCNIEKIFTKLVPLNNQVETESKPNIGPLFTDASDPPGAKWPPPKTHDAPVLAGGKNRAKHSTTREKQPIQLTLENAISILNRYCNKLPSDTFTKMVPNYKIDSVPQPDGSVKYRCRLFLPINSTYRDEIVGELQDTQALAKQVAAFQTVKTLQAKKELGPDYYPVGKETSHYIEKLGMQECCINTKGQHKAGGGGSTGPQPHSKGNRYNRAQNRNIACKRRQYYNKRVASSLRGPVFKSGPDGSHYIQYLYMFDLKLTCRLTDEQNSRGRKIVDPVETSRTFGIIVPQYLPPLCDFAIYTRSGEVTISLRPLIAHNTGSGLKVTPEQMEQIENFHRFTFENVLPLGKSSLKFDAQNGSNGNYLIVPINQEPSEEGGGDVQIGIDWKFIELIWRHVKNSNAYNESLLRYDANGCFVFDESLYRDAVVIPKYRMDKLQAFYYVAEICHDLTPFSAFPDSDYRSFAEYYQKKYSKEITNPCQPLLDVDHTSARLNLLTPRLLNRKGSQQYTVPAKHHQSKRNPQQKQILVPELCYIHPFPASFWRKAVGLPCVLYRLNLLLVAEELRFKIAKEANIGQTDLPEGQKWPKLDFGWSVLVEKARAETGIVGCPALSDNVPEPLVQDSVMPGTTVQLAPDDPFSTMTIDDWSSVALNETEIDVSPPVPPINSFLDMPMPIEILSGPFQSGKTVFLDDSDQYTYDDDESFDDTDEECDVIQEVDEFGRELQNHHNRVIGRQFRSDRTKGTWPVRAGSPTYWEQFKENQRIEEEKDIWTQPLSEAIIDESKFEFKYEKFCKSINNVINEIQDNCMDDDSWEDRIPKLRVTDIAEEQQGCEKVPPAKKTRAGKSKKGKSVATSLSDLDDDYVEDKVTYSDFDTDDSEEDEFDFDEDDEEESDQFDEDDFDLSEKATASSKRSISKWLNIFQIRSVLYDVLKIELLFEGKRIEKHSMKYYYQAEHFRKRKFFNEMYHEEKKLVLKCIDKICRELEPDSSLLDGDQATTIYGPPDEELFDKGIEDIDLGEGTLLDLVMSKIESDDLDSLNHPFSDKPESNIEQQKEGDWGEQQHDFFNRSDAFSNLLDQKTEVKFGELLPNRDKEAKTGRISMVELLRQQRETALQTLPKWLQTNTADDPVLKLGPHPSLILQAITMSNSSDGINLERLETVGDSFLKYSTTAFLFCMCPDLNEGRLSFLRSRQISNINLHRLGQRINLGELMIASKFEPVDNWCPPSYQVVENIEGQTKPNNKVPYNLLTQHSIPNKSIADCVEALIGTYLISSGSQGAIQFMDWLDLKVLPKGMKMITQYESDQPPDQLNREKWLRQPRSPLIIRENREEAERKLQEIYYKNHLDRFEEILGYRFKDRAYLVQAFTHNSYYENTVTDCYQRLEFLGDAVLDYLITRYLYEDPRCHTPGTLTDLRSALVNNTFFAALAVKYSFHKYLMMLSSELYRVIDGFVRKFDIYYNTHQRKDNYAINELNLVNQNDFDASSDDLSCNYWELFISENEAEHLEDIEVPKALGDIFESVAGAIYLDSGMSLEAVWKAYYPMMKPEIENFSEKVPKSPIRVLLEKQPQSVKFGKPEITSCRRVRVTVEVFGLGKFVGIGRNKRIAKCTAAKRALRALENPISSRHP